MATEDEFDGDIDAEEDDIELDDDLEIDDDLELDSDLEIDDGDDFEETDSDDDEDDDTLAPVADDDAEDADDDAADEEVEEEDDDDEDLDDDLDDETEESLEVLLGTDADEEEPVGESRNSLTKAANPIGEGEFTCRSCFLVKRRAQLADPKALICLDCA